MSKQRILCDFNSIKVQLKQASQRIIVGATGFQFHKGTIKTASVSTPAADFPISIP